MKKLFAVGLALCLAFFALTCRSAVAPIGNPIPISSLTNLSASMLLVGSDPLIGNRTYTKILVATNGIGNAVSASAANQFNRALIFVPNGTYTEEVDLTSKPWVDLIGESRTGVVWTSSSQANDTLFLGGMNCLIANMTISHVTAPAQTQKYPIHADDSNYPGLTASSVIVYNCTLSASGGFGKSGIGIGLYGGQSIFLINCLCTSDATDGVFIHNATAQSIPCQAYLLNCTVISTNSTGLLIQNQNSGQSDLVSVVGGYVSGAPTDIVTFNNVGTAGEIFLAVSTNGPFSTAFKTSTLVNPDRWIRNPIFPPTIDFQTDLRIGAPQTSYFAFMPEHFNMFARTNNANSAATMGLWAIPSPTAGTGPTFSLGDGGNGVPFAEIEGDKASGTYSGWLSLKVMTEGVAFSEQARVTTTGFNTLAAGSQDGAPASPIIQPIGHFGFLSMTNPAGSPVIIGSAGVYQPVTNYQFAITNSFGANLAKGILTNLVAGYYRITISSSSIPPTASDAVDTDLMINGTVTELIAAHSTGQTGASKYITMGTSGILYLPAGSWLQIAVTDTTTTGTFSVNHAQLTIDTP
jgi:hypothetical protein